MPMPCMSIVKSYQISLIDLFRISSGVIDIETASLLSKLGFDPVEAGAVITRQILQRLQDYTASRPLLGTNDAL